ncbi:phosphate transport system regulatory protein PhoU [Methanothermobacter thermautotrophicus]|uniref:Phosphate-specific transport system accessory protein PhoU n=1 Tax=Methanothermobacter thermautotrophicus TaxID=145262 RepID=A0A842YL79_METTF|nr:phosphate signaling complex protein PhoU [Methanothermobacter thermautotrophicus]MBE2899717.1 phosphate transport system regulatory protein PhoU [Methanothermobacter thermautotrophicus]
MEKKYPRILFRKRLKDLRKDMEEVSQKTLKTHKLAVDLLMEYDDEKKEKVIKNSRTIDDMVFNLERKAISLIAAEQPVAGDLRFIEACIKVGSHLKRIGYLAANIAEAAEKLKDEEIPRKPLEDLKHMSDFVQMMLSKGIYAFLDQNMEMARELRHDDDKVDDLFDQTLEHVTRSMFEDKESISYLVNLLFIARFLERVGDRAVSIADRTIFMITCEKP